MKLEKVSTVGRTGAAVRRIAIAMTVAVASGATLFTGAGQAQADSSWSNGWDTYSDPFRCTVGSDEATYFCMYYNSGAEGAIWKSQAKAQNFYVYGTTFQDDGYGSNGAGVSVANNAASAENDSFTSTLAVYSNWNETGDVTYIPAGRGGNLSSYVKNADGSAQLLG